MNDLTGVEYGALALDAILADGSTKPSKPLSTVPNILRGSANKQQDQLQIASLHTFMAQEIAPRKTVLSPWLMTQSLNMIYGWRGIGKTHVSLAICYAVACGGSFLNWRADQPRRVLLLD